MQHIICKKVDVNKIAESTGFNISKILNSSSYSTIEEYVRVNNIKSNDIEKVIMSMAIDSGVINFKTLLFLFKNGYRNTRGDSFFEYHNIEHIIRTAPCKKITEYICGHKYDIILFEKTNLIAKLKRRGTTYLYWISDKTFNTVSGVISDNFFEKEFERYWLLHDTQYAD